MASVTRKARWMIFAGVMVISACANNHDWTESPGKAMDRVAKGLEEYGSVTMSAPLLSRPDPATNFDFKYTADRYFADAKNNVQAVAASLEQISQSFGLGISVQTDPTVMAAYAAKLKQYSADQTRIDQKQSLIDSAAKLEYLAAVQKALAETDQDKRATALAAAERSYAANLSSPSTNKPVFPTISSAGNTPVAASGLVKQSTDALNALTSTKFKDYLGLISSLSPNVTPTISNRSALITAAGDQAVEGIFRILGNQGEAQKFKDKAVLFGVTMVSVDPGWRTKEDFAADISVAIDYRERAARKEVIELLLKDEKLKKGLRKKIAADYAMENSLPDDLKKDYDELTKDLNTARESEKTKIKKDIQDGETSRKKTQEKIDALNQSPKKKKLSAKEKTKNTALLAELQKQITANDAAIAALKKQDEESEASFQKKNTQLIKEKKEIEEEQKKCIFSIPDWLARASFKNKYPLVSAISPMTETEALDLSSSTRRQEEFALSLSFALRYAGLGAQAEAFEQFAKSRQKDMRTRSASAAINTYSASGGVFGFQIGPRLRAIADPSSTDSAPGNILERQAFPALVLIGFDKDDLRPRICVQEGKIQVWEPALYFVQTTNWVPVKDKWYSWLHKPRLSERERLEWSAALADASDETDTICNHINDYLKETSKKCGTQNEKGEFRCTEEMEANKRLCSEKYAGGKGLLEIRKRFFKYRAFGSYMEMAIPAELLVTLDEPPKKIVLPQVAAIVPKEVELTKKNDGSVEPKGVNFVLAGTGLDAVNLKGVKTLTGFATIQAGTNPILVGGAIIISLDVKGNDAPIVFMLPLDPAKSGIGTADKPVSIVTLPVTVSKKSLKTEKQLVSKTAKIVTYDKTSDGAGKKDSITLSFDSTLPAKTTAAAKEIIVSDINKNKSSTANSANVSVSVQAENTPKVP